MAPYWMREVLLLQDGTQGGQYDARGFDFAGKHQSGTWYDNYGLDMNGAPRPLPPPPWGAFGGAGVPPPPPAGFFPPVPTPAATYDENGFDNQPPYNHRDTGTPYNSKGEDRKGFKADGTWKTTGKDYDTGGYKKDGYHKDTGLDIRGFQRNKTYKQTGRLTNEAGFLQDGNHPLTGRPWDEQGYQEDGYHYITNLNRSGFNRDGINSFTNTEYDSEGYGVNGYHKDTGFNRHGYDRTGRLQGKSDHDALFEADAGGGGSNTYAIDDAQAVQQFLADIPNLQTALEYFNANGANISLADIGHITDVANQAFYATGTHPPVVPTLGEKIIKIAKKLFVGFIRNPDEQASETLARHHTILTIYGYGNAGLSAREEELQKRLKHQ